MFHSLIRVSLCLVWGGLLSGCGAIEGSDTQPHDGQVDAQAQSLGICTTFVRGGPSATQDATIAFSPFDPTLGSANFGAVPTLSVGSAAIAQRASLLQFNLSPIPAGSTVTSATLSLFQGSRLGTGTANVYAVLAPWQEANVTWTSFGAAFNPVATTTFLPSSVGVNTSLTVDLTALTQQWVSGGLSNHGIYMDLPANGRALWGASEAGVSSRRPSLTVCYCTPSPEVCNGVDDDCDGLVDEGGVCGGCAPTGGAPWIVGEVSQVYGSDVSDITLDDLGNSYETGHFGGDLDLGGGVVLTSSVDWQGYSTFDCYVGKRDPAGALLWAAVIYDTDAHCYGGSVAQAGNDVYVTLDATYYDYDYAYGDVLVTKLDAGSGALQWTTSIVGNTLVYASDVSVSPSGEVLAGASHRYVDLYNQVDGPASGLVAALSPVDGQVLWSRALDGTDDVRLRRLAVDATGATVVTGDFNGTLQVGAGTLVAAGDNDGFVLKLDSAGVPQWFSSFGAAGQSQTAGDVAVDSAGNVVVSATLSGSLAFAGGPSLTSLGGTDLGLAAFDSSGAHLWSRRLGGTGQETAGRLVLDPTGVLSATGLFDHGADFGGGPLATDYPTTYLVQHDLGGNFVAQRDLRFLGVAGLAADCAGNLYGGGSWTGDSTLGTAQAPKKVVATFSLGQTPTPPGAGACSGGAYCDNTTCYAPGSTVSVLHCACGNLNPACGIGTCGGGAYCEGNGCANPQCFGPGSPEGRGMCGGGVASTPSCTVTGGVKRAFVTSTLTTGNMGGVAGADTLCQNAADSAALGGTYKAFLGVGAALPQDRVAHFDGPYVRTDGVTVVPNWTHFDPLFPDLLAPIDKTETGGIPPTGTATYLGQPATWVGYYWGTCSDWTDATFGNWGGIGAVQWTQSLWYFGGANHCSETAALYCFEQ